jgi:hypothetical protein
LSVAALRARVRSAAGDHPWAPRALILAWLVWVWTAYFAPDPPSYVRNPLSALTLVVHEAGHAAFLWFGNDLLTVAGGSIFQLLIPLLVAWLFWRQRDVFAVCVALFWLGTSLVEMGIYAADARAQALPLVSPWGGEGDAQNDWTTMLMRFGKLSRDAIIGGRIHGAGMALMPVALATAAWVVWSAAHAPLRPGARFSEEERLAAAPGVRAALDAVRERGDR